MGQDRKTKFQSREPGRILRYSILDRRIEQSNPFGKTTISSGARCWWLERNQLIAKSQYGFRKQKSCVDNLAILRAKIDNEFVRKNHLVSVFLDVKGAYDNVLADILINRLKDLKIPVNLLNFIYNLVCERNLHCRISGADAIYTTFKGLPQGSSLSPLLYNIYTKRIENEVLEECGILQFADDIALFSGRNPIQQSLDIVERSVENINKFLSQSGLEFSMKINNVRIKPQSQVKFLGVIFEHNLKWKKHIDKVVQSCHNSLKIMNCLRHTWWGADPIILMNLYKTLIRSRIEYATFIVEPSDQNLLSKLDRIQFKAIRSALGFRTSTPTNILLAEPREPPLRLRKKYLCQKFLTKVLSFSGHPLIDIVRETSESFNHPLLVTSLAKPLMVKCFEEIEPFSHIVASFEFPHLCNTEFLITMYRPVISFKEGLIVQSSPSPQSEFLAIFNEEVSREKIEMFFTDGSKMGEEQFVGFATFRTNTSTLTKRRSDSKTSIFSAEAMAIVETLQIIQKLNIPKAYIFSDSSSVLKSCDSHHVDTKTSYLILKIKELAYRLAENNKMVKFFWIPAHVGVRYNEIVDKGAKNAIRDGIYCQLLDTADHVFWQCPMYIEPRKKLVSTLTKCKMRVPYSIAAVMASKSKKAIRALAVFVNKIDLRI
ncbi:uncharacterized protein [Venturia canescens]|uniref:uncharacterized protein n=1 Tax=Venturia canescens TaxID=32260 RepID=UPI001C9C96E0|nr:uncharacterized protein LOC122406333 [Venturia canescens]